MQIADYLVCGTLLISMVTYWPSTLE